MFVALGALHIALHASMHVARTVSATCGACCTVVNLVTTPWFKISKYSSQARTSLFLYVLPSTNPTYPPVLSKQINTDHHGIS